MRWRWLLLVLAVGAPGKEASANKLESWYTYWGLGYVDVTYPGELEHSMDLLAKAPEVSHIPICLDFLGFYWPRSEQTILGVVVNSFGDRYVENEEWIQFNGYLVSFSSMFFFRQIGEGLFTRGDLGMAFYVLDSSLGGDEKSDAGVGILLGGGYAKPITDGTRLLFNVNYAIRRVEGENTRTLGISLGGLF